jgi:hypothetical protein
VTGSPSRKPRSLPCAGSSTRWRPARPCRPERAGASASPPTGLRRSSSRARSPACRSAP